MTRYVTIRMTREQAQAASNACDLIADSYEADGNKREASIYHRACTTLSQIRPANKPGQPNRKPRR